MRSEFAQAREVEPNESHGETFDLFNLNEQEQVRLKQEIDKTNGKVRVFIHPTFADYAEHEKKEEQKKTAERAEDALLRLFKSTDKKQLPLIVFLSAINEEEYAEELYDMRQKVGADHRVYFVRTEFANPHPLDPAEYTKYRWPTTVLKRKNFDRDTMWELTAEQMKELGVKTLLLGGAELYASNNPSVDDDFFGGCLGIAYGKLKDKFFIEKSRITWPDKFSHNQPLNQE